MSPFLFRSSRHPSEDRRPGSARHITHQNPSTRGASSKKDDFQIAEKRLRSEQPAKTLPSLAIRTKEKQPAALVIFYVLRFLHKLYIHIYIIYKIT
jgi:hypothetical protein